MYYQCIAVDGEITLRKSMSLEEIQDFVGGYFEFHKGFFVNEEGNLQNLPINRVYRRYRGNVIELIKGEIKCKKKLVKI